MTAFGSKVGAELRRTLIGYPSIDSAALYGSVARGDVEPHSDVDLLLVCNGSVKERLYLELTDTLSETCRNLSISLYSPAELAFMKRVGSLFLLHLRNEGILLFDRSGILANILNEFVPKPSYKSDFKKSLGLLAPMRTAVCGARTSCTDLPSYMRCFVFSVFICWLRDASLNSLRKR